MKTIITSILVAFAVTIGSAQTFQKYIQSSGNASYPGWYANAVGYDPITSSIFIQADQHDGSTAPAGLIKVDTCGNVLWAKYTSPQGSSYGASGTYYNGGFSVMNRTTGSSAGGFITSILNYNGSGTLVSSTGVNTNASSVVDAHLVTSKRMPNGDILATGYGPVTNHFKDILYCKLNQTGTVIWSKYSGQNDSYWENGWGCDFDPINLDCYFVGQNISFSQTGSTDIHVIKTDVNGNTLWIKNIATPATDVGWCVKVLSNQDVVIIANTTNNSSANQEISFIKLSSAGNLITSCKYQATNTQNVIRNVNTLPNGNLLLTGYTNSFGSGGLDGLLMEVDLSGNIIWQKAYGSVDNDHFINSVFFNNSIFTAGARDFGNTGGTGYQLYLVKTKLDGTFNSANCNVTNGGFVKLAENYTIFNVNNVTPTGFNIANNFTSQSVITTQTVICGKPTASFTPQTPICANQTISLTDQSLNAPNSWTWTSTANNILNPYLQNQSSISFTAAGTFTVQLKVANCVGVDSIKKVIVVNPNPTITPTSNSPLCTGATLSLAIVGAGTCTWTGPSGFNSNTQNPTVSNVQTGNSGIYTVSLTSASGCVSNGTINAIVSSVPNPSISATGSNPMCLGGLLNLSATGALSYTWSSGVATGTNIIVTPTANITYTVLGSNSGSSCTNTAVYSVTVNPKPTVSITGNSVICNGQSTSLNAGGASSYVWITSSNSTSITITPSVTTTYSVVGTNAVTNCTNNAVYTVSVNANPVLSVTGNTTICNGQNTILQANGATTYLWNTGVTTTSISLNPGATSTYSVIGVNSVTGCTATAIKTVIVNALPTIVISGNNTICNLQSTTLVAGGANTYVWNTSSNSNSITINPTASTAYSVVGTNTLTGCSNSANTQVTVNPLPVVTINGNNNICALQTVSLTASGANSYAWNTFQTSASITNNPSYNSTFTVTGTNVNTGCQGTATFVVTVNQNPIVTITGNPLVCQSQSTTLNANGANTYTWSTNASGNSISLTPLVNTTYSVIGANTAGCKSTAIYNVTVVAIPVLNVIGNTTVCAGEKINLTASGATNYVWSTNQYTNEIELIPTATGTLVVSGSNNTGCSTVKYIPVTVNPVSVASFYIDSVLKDCSYNFFIKGNFDNNVKTVDWFVNGNFYSNADAINYTLGLNKNENIQLTVTNIFGCTTTMNKTIYTDKLYENIVYMPNSFTPNGDGLNDNWFIVGDCLEKVKCSIFDRWGQLLATLNNIGEAWNGTFKGAVVKDDIYVYKLSGTFYNKKTYEKTGMITVIK